MSKIMVIAGGTWQVPIVKLAKEMGHYVICTNLYENSPAFEYADVGVVANVLDKEKNLEIAKVYQPDAVLTDQSDIAVPTVAYVAEKLRIKGISIVIANRFTNKYLMRYFTEKAGFATPKYKLCYSLDDTKKFLEEVKKCIIKPLDSQSSRGVHIVCSQKDVEEKFEDCIKYSNSEKAILIEEYIEGTEFTVDGIKLSNDYIVTAISQKEHYTYNPSVANRLVFSQKNEQFDYDKLRKINSDMVRALELPFGCTHAEYKFSKGEFYLIEIAARGGGTKISSDIVPLVSGINSNALYIKELLNEKITIISNERHEWAVLGFFDFKSGIVKQITGIEKAKQIKGVWDLNIEIQVGDRISPACDDRSRCGYYIIYASSKKELEEREQLVKDTIKVVTE